MLVAKLWYYLHGVTILYVVKYFDICLRSFIVSKFFFRFDLYFRKNPFGGEYTVFAGLEECIRFIANFKLTEEEISFVRESLPSSCEVN